MQTQFGLSRVPWPPLILLSCIVGGLALDGIRPLNTPFWSWIFGVPIVAVALAFEVGAVVAMRRARTNIMPFWPADRLLTSGVFEWSRHPIYLGNTLLIFGLGLTFANGWLILAVPFAGMLVDRLAVRPEEQHLAETFGAAYDAYRGRTARWFGRRRRVGGG